MRDRYHMHTEITPGCDSCHDGFERSKSICAFCWMPVTNKTFLSGDYHQTGRCKARLRYKEPKRTVDKPLPYPMPNRGIKMPYNDENYKPIKWKFARKV